MTAYEAVLAERRRNRRIARWIEGVVVILVLVAALVVFLGYHPERASACSVKHHHPCLAHAAFYDHVAVCEDTLRGNPGDDDVHILGVATGAQSFGGWGGYGHYSDGSVYVWGLFNYSYGKVASYKGRCSGGDYVSDWFVGF